MYGRMASYATRPKDVSDVSAAQIGRSSTKPIDVGAIVEPIAMVRVDIGDQRRN